VVSKSACSNSPLNGKSFEILEDKSVRLETPISKVGRLSILLKWQQKDPTVIVNPTYHRLARVTIGNVHSVGWLARDLTNILLLANNYALLHAAALKYKDRVIVLFGLSNTGKTKTVFTLVKEHGAKFYGDDLVLTDGEKLYPCPQTGANIDPSEGPGVGYKIEQTLRRGLPFFENVAGTLSYSISQALGASNVAEVAPVTDVVIMRKAESGFREEIDIKRATDLMIASNRTEFTYSSSAICSAAEYFESGINVTAALAAENNVMKKLANQARCHYAAGDFSFLQNVTRDILDIPA